MQSIQQNVVPHVKTQATDSIQYFCNWKSKLTESRIKTNLIYTFSIPDEIMYDKFSNKKE